MARGHDGWRGWLGGKREIRESTIMPVISALRAITFEQVRGVLDKKKNDAKVGIGVVNLSEQGVVNPVEVGEPPLRYQFYVAYVPPGGHVNSHYHKHGPEPYRFMFDDTAGEMNLGTVRDGKSGQEVKWKKPVKVKQGDEVEIAEGEVHSFYNTGDQPVFFLFCCPGEHLVDHSHDHPEGDRYITEHLPNGTGKPPQHRPKH